MNFPRRAFLRLAGDVAMLPLVSQIVRAQTYPSRPLRIFVGNGYLGAADRRLAIQAIGAARRC